MANVKDLLNLEGRVSVVTGGATGIGLRMALGLAEAGSSIVIASRKLDACEEAAHEIEKTGAKALAVACDVTKADQVEAMKDAVMKRFGRVDALVNNAGRAWVARARGHAARALAAGVRSQHHRRLSCARRRWGAK